MKYCRECRKLYDDTVTVCKDCNKKCNTISDINEPVLLSVVGGVERSMICGALTDAEIPFVEKPYGKQGVSNEIVTGYDVKLLNIAIEVPYSAVPKAYEILKSLELDSERVEDIVEEVAKDVEEYKNNLKNDNSTQMSDAKRTTVRVLSAIVFVVVLALIIWGTDYVLELIKNLFGG